MTRVSLVLGSGGARGYAHIGVIEALEARGYEIACISGCSMGAVVGGMYAAGKLEDFRDWVVKLDYIDILRLVDVTWSALGAMRGDKILAEIKDLLGDIRIEELPIPYTSVATDLVRQKEVWFQQGPLHQAIRASIAVPGVIDPVRIGERVLVDGGLLNPLPIIPTVSAQADLIVAVNVTATSELEVGLPELPKDNGERADSNRLNEWIGEIKGRTTQMLERVQLWENSDDKDSPPIKGRDSSWSKLDIMNLSFETTQAALTQYKIAGYPPDVLIEVPKTVCRSYEFYKAPELIELGRRLGHRALDQLESERAWQQRHPDVL